MTNKQVATPDWVLIRRHAESTGAGNTEIGNLFGISADSVRMRRKREGWKLSDGVCYRKLNRENEQANKVNRIEDYDPVELSEEERKELMHISSMLAVGIGMITEKIVGSDGKEKTVPKKDLKGADYKAVVDANKDLWDRHRAILGKEIGLPDAGSKYVKKEDKRKMAVDTIQKSTPFKPLLVKVA